MKSASLGAGLGRWQGHFHTGRPTGGAGPQAGSGRVTVVPELQPRPAGPANVMRHCDTHSDSHRRLGYVV